MPLPLSVTLESVPAVVASTTTLPPLPRLLAKMSLSWTVTAEVELPFAVIEPGAAEMVEAEASAGAATTVSVEVSVLPA